MHKSALPGWFLGMLGCLSVLGVGFGALIVVARNGLLDGGAVGTATAAAAPVAAPTEPAPAAASVGSRPQPQIEQLVPPPAAPLIPAGEPKARTQPHAIKLARSPSAGHSAAVDKAAADKPAAEKPGGDDKSAGAADEAATAKKPADKVPGEDDQVVRHHKTAASDEDDDDD